MTKYEFQFKSPRPAPGLLQRPRNKLFHVSVFTCNSFLSHNHLQQCPGGLVKMHVVLLQRSQDLDIFLDYKKSLPAVCLSCMGTDERHRDTELSSLDIWKRTRGVIMRRSHVGRHDNDKDTPAHVLRVTYSSHSFYQRVVDYMAAHCIFNYQAFKHYNVVNL